MDRKLTWRSKGYQEKIRELKGGELNRITKRITANEGHTSANKKH